MSLINVHTDQFKKMKLRKTFPRLFDNCSARMNGKIRWTGEEFHWNLFLVVFSNVVFSICFTSSSSKRSYKVWLVTVTLLGAFALALAFVTAIGTLEALNVECYIFNHRVNWRDYLKAAHVDLVVCFHWHHVLAVAATTTRRWEHLPSISLSWGFHLPRSSMNMVTKITRWRVVELQARFWPISLPFLCLFATSSNKASKAM